jgi:hypothetical protein
MPAKRAFTILLITLAVQLLLILLVLLSPYLGLGEREAFVVYRVLKLSRFEAFSWLCLTLISTCLVYVLFVGRERNEKSRGEFWKSLYASAVKGAGGLFLAKHERTSRRGHIHVALLVLFFVATFAMLLARSRILLSEQTDQHYHLAAIDFDVDWGTPFFSLAGNLLNNFGVQIPLNGNLAPVLGLARRFFPAQQIEVSMLGFFLLTGGLLWMLGYVCGIRPVPRTLVAGIAALLLTVPTGLDRILFVIPPIALSHFLILGLWWYEDALLVMGAVLAFLLLGLRPGAAMNVLLAAAFWILCYLVLLAFPAGAVFAVPIIAIYCAVFLFSAASRAELLWKGAGAAALAVAFLITHIPTFFTNLYSYTFSTFLQAEPGPAPWWQVLERPFSADSNIATVYMQAHALDRRMFFVWIVSIICACITIFKSSGLLRRLAIGVVSCEIGIPVVAAANMAIAQHAYTPFYSEMFHLPLLVWFFALAMLILLIPLDRRLQNAIAAAPLRFRTGDVRARPALRYGAVVYWGIAALLIGRYAFTTPRDQYAYSAAQPQSVRMLKDEIAAKPGEPFHGRLLVLVGTQGAPGMQWYQGSHAVSDAIFRYRVFLGNDHYISLAAFGIPLATEYGHWTSPVTYAFLRAFFSHRDDVFSDRAFFPLRVFNPRVAKLMGMRMVATDAPEIAEGKLVYETMAGDSPLRLFRLDGVNLGQYSPTRPIMASTAAEALSTIGNPAFNPEDDVVVEKALELDLVPAQAAEVVTDFGPTLSVRAESTGWSMLVLPFEYSACLQLHHEGSPAARIIPVNLQQTGLLFQGRIDVRLAYRYGPLDHPECRRQDVERANRIELRQAVQQIEAKRL